MSRYVNLILQGGGVKGLSYAGALSRLPEGIEIRVVGGSSAGAIAAALIACGHNPRNLQAILETLDVSALLSNEAMAVLQDLRDLSANISRLAKAATDAGVPFVRAASFILWNRKSLRRHYRKLAKSWGMFSSEALETWLADKTQKRKFSEIDTHDLRIVASNVSTGAYFTYSRGETPNDYVYAAATASAMIPFFFEPRRDGGVLVDGGMLSNFPLFLFEREPFPTVGFRLRPIAQPNIQVQIQSLGGFALQLLETMMDAHDKIRPRPEHFHEEVISLPSTISAIDFDLKKEEKELLFLLGSDAGGKVDWQTFSSSTPVFSGLDPKPDKVITRVLQNGQRLSDAVNSTAIRPEVLYDDASFAVTIHTDWSVSYLISHRYKVEGDKVFIGGGSKLTFREDTLNLAETSLADLDWEFLEVLADGQTQQLPRFPAQNDVRERKFVYLFMPPVSAGASARTFVNKWRIPREMEATVGRGIPDTIGYDRTPRAKRHFLDLKMEVLVANSLGVTLSSENANLDLRVADDKYSLQGVSYTQWKAGTGQIELPIQARFLLQVQRC